MALDHIKNHLDLIARHEQEFLTKRSAGERLGDSLARFAGSLPFVCVHLVVFTVWIGVNSLRIGRVPHFDPAPFSLLGTLVALEAILLASIILMRQTRMSRRADERESLMLQVLLLTEKEITAVLALNRQVAQQLGLKRIANDEEISQLSKETQIDEVAREIQEILPPE